MASPAPVVAATPRPVAVVASPAEVPPASPIPAELAPDEAGVVRPRLTGGVFWPLALDAGADGNNFPGYSRPAPTLGLTLWQGAWGVRAATTIFGDTYSLTGGQLYFHADTFLTDVQLAWRTVDDSIDRSRPDDPERAHGELALGYRTLGLADLNFGTLGLRGIWPLGMRDLSLTGSALAGYAPGGTLVGDASLGLAMRARILTAELGLRVLWLGGGVPPLWAVGPTARLGLVF